MRNGLYCHYHAQHVQTELKFFKSEIPLSVYTFFSLDYCKWITPWFTFSFCNTIKSFPCKCKIVYEWIASRLSSWFFELLKFDCCSRKSFDRRNFGCIGHVYIDKNNKQLVILNLKWTPFIQKDNSNQLFRKGMVRNLTHLLTTRIYVIQVKIQCCFSFQRKTSCFELTF